MGVKSYFLSEAQIPSRFQVKSLHFFIVNRKSGPCRDVLRVIEAHFYDVHVRNQREINEISSAQCCRSRDFIANWATFSGTYPRRSAEMHSVQ